MSISTPNGISIGRPVLYFANSPEVAWNTHYPVGFSYVQLYYLMGGGVMNLYSGDHPILTIKGSDLHFTFVYHGNSDGDMAKLIDAAVRREVSEILGKSRIEISRGEPVLTAPCGFFHPKVVIEPPIKGLIIDPTKVVVHSDYFEP